MSSEKGNTKRTRRQKYQNRTVFKNDLHDTSKRTKAMNSMQIAEVCKPCKTVIEWKIKYKKYKPLSQPKTCLQCHQKNIKFAYHTLCGSCGAALGACCKCRVVTEVVKALKIKKPKEEVIALMHKHLKALPERKRRTFYRYLDKIYGTKKKKSNEDGEEDEEEEEEEEEQIEDDGEDYMEKIRKKLEELGKGMLVGLDEEDEDDDFSSGHEGEREA